MTYKSKEKKNANLRTWYAKNRDRAFRYTLQRTYGLAPALYDTLLLQQDNKCAICDKPVSKERYGRLYVDHDHKTGLVRGLLCNGCNCGIGQFKEDVVLLEKAAKYLVKNARP